MTLAELIASPAVNRARVEGSVSLIYAPPIVGAGRMESATLCYERGASINRVKLISRAMLVVKRGWGPLVVLYNRRDQKGIIQSAYLVSCRNTIRGEPPRLLL